MTFTDRRTLIAYRVISDLAGKGAFLLITMGAARRLPAEAFGVFALGSTLGWMAGVLTDAGLQMHIARTVARAAPGRAGPIFERWLPWRLAAAAVAFAVITAAAALWTSDWRTAMALSLLVASWLCSAVTEFVHHFFRGLSRSDIESTITLVSRLALLGLAAGVLVLAPALLTLAAAMVAVTATTTVIAVLVARRLVTRDNHGPVTAGTAAPGGPRRVDELLRQAAPVGIGIVLSALYFRLDVVLVEHWQGAAAVGTYNAAFRLIEGLRLMPAAALAVALPALCRATSAGPMLRLAGQLGLASVPIVALSWAAAAWLLPLLFGDRFVDAVPAFRVLLLAYPLMTLNYVLTTQLIAWDRHGTFAVLCAIALGVNVALNVRLIPSASIVGAAWSVVGTEACLTAGCVVALALPAQAGSPARAAGTAP